MSNPFSGALASMTAFNRRANRAEFAVGALIIGPMAIIPAAVIVGSLGLASQSLANVGFAGLMLVYFIGLTLLIKNRFNDFNASGWWQLVPLAGIVALFMPGTEGVNNWGVRK
jgi:uncharacterized membrane protein YhaH (DUF805 family)